MAQSTHPCEETCLHDCPECGHEVDHMADTLPVPIDRARLLRAIPDFIDGHSVWKEALAEQIAEAYEGDGTHHDF